MSVASLILPTWPSMGTIQLSLENLNEDLGFFVVVVVVLRGSKQGTQSPESSQGVLWDTLRPTVTTHPMHFFHFLWVFGNCFSEIQREV